MRDRRRSAAVDDEPSSAPLRLDVAATASAVAVINRQAKQTDVRTYTRDGAVIAGFQFGADAQFLPYDDRRLPAGGARDHRRLRGHRDRPRPATAAPDSSRPPPTRPSTCCGAIVLSSDGHRRHHRRALRQRRAPARIVPWSTVLGAADRDAFKTGRIFGMAAQPDRVMVAWGSGSALRLAVHGRRRRAADAHRRQRLLQLFRAATRRPPCRSTTGLLMFDGNPVRADADRVRSVAHAGRPEHAAAHVLSNDAPGRGDRAAGPAGRLLADGLPRHRQLAGRHHPPTLRRASWTSPRPPPARHGADRGDRPRRVRRSRSSRWPPRRFPATPRSPSRTPMPTGGSWLRVANLDCARPAP